MMEKRKRKSFAKKSLGQNFLADQNYIRKIVDAVNPQPDEIIIEIGAGRGALTEFLIEKAGNVIAVELDSDLIPLLNESFGKNKNFSLVHKDVLEINFRELFEKNNPHDLTNKAKLAANLPYYISTAILQHLVEYRAIFSQLVIMLQKEVVGRITAGPGKKERGYLTVLTEAFFESHKLFDVPPNAFRPAPKVWSSVIILKPRPFDKIISENEILFRNLIGYGFAQKRKTIYNNLKNAAKILYKKDLSEILLENEINPKRRAETLTIDEWRSLTESLAHEQI